MRGEIEKEIGVDLKVVVGWLEGKGEFRKETVCGYFGFWVSRNMLLPCMTLKFRCWILFQGRLCLSSGGPTHGFCGFRVIHRLGRVKSCRSPLHVF